MKTLVRVLVIGFLLYVAFAIGCGGVDPSQWPKEDRTCLGWLLITQGVLVAGFTVLKHDELI
jgi:hypothetical protein